MTPATNLFQLKYNSEFASSVSSDNHGPLGQWTKPGLWRHAAVHCCASGRAEVVEALLKAGCDMDKAEEITGATPLYAAAQQGHKRWLRC